MKKIDLVILDLDNTVWDWVSAWHTSFSAAINVAVGRFGISEAALKPLVKAVHERHGTAEYPFWVYEIEQLRAVCDPVAFSVVADELRNAAGAAWHSLPLYPDVISTLTSMAQLGVRLVGFTESFEYHTRYRLRRTGLDGLLDAVYSPAGHGIPEYLDQHEHTRLRQERQPLARAIYATLNEGEAKPDPQVLLDIIESQRGAPDLAACVGDSKLKDVLMAQRAGVADVHAAYGESQHLEAYKLLKEVTHWPSTLVKSEASAMTAGAVSPTYTLRHGFGELLSIFEFVPFQQR